MLKLLRKKGVAKKVLWFVAIIIIISFGFFGTAGRMNRNNHSYAGKIFGHKISFDDFRKMYKQTKVQALMQYGEKFYSIQDYLNLDSATWDRLILLHEANKRRIRVSDKKLIATIESLSFFQKNNIFDKNLYNLILRNAFGMTANEFEEGLRDKLKFSELKGQETENVTIKEANVFNFYKNANEKVQISYVFVDPENFKKDVQVDESETKEYYEKHKKDFLTSPQINIDYISIDFPEKPPIENIGKLTDEEKQKAEDKINQDFDTAKEKISDQADDIYDQLQEDSDIGKIAKNNGIKIKTTGFFSMDKPKLALGGSYPLLNAIFKLKKGEITEPFETHTGIIIAQLKEKKDSYIPEFSEASEKAKNSITNIKAKEFANKKAAEYLGEIKKEFDKTMLKDFAKTAKALGLEIYQTPAFTRGQYLPKIGISKEFDDSAFSLTEKNPISNVVKTAKGFCILHLDKYFPVDKNTFDKEKDSIREKLLEKKKDKVFEQFLINLRLKANLEDNIPKKEKQSQTE